MLLTKSCGQAGVTVAIRKVEGTHVEGLDDAADPAPPRKEAMQEFLDFFAEADRCHGRSSAYAA